jgi:hypothetical protein
VIDGILSGNTHTINKNKLALYKSQQQQQQKIVK